jgi:Ca2+/H+ antiporter, TMEM165/GDT1 family
MEMPVVQFNILFSTFALILAAEIGDKSLLVAFSFSSTTRRPLVIFMASVSALIISNIIAALLGAVTVKILPNFTEIIAAALFISVGVFILFKKDPPLLKECFLEAINLENLIIRMVPRIFKKAGFFDDQIKALLDEDKSHTDGFEYLIKEKRVHSYWEAMEEEFAVCLDTMKKQTTPHKLPFPEAIEVIIAMEESVLAFFQTMLEYLSEEGAQDEGLRNMIETLVEEESAHVRIFKEYRGRAPG